MRCPFCTHDDTQVVETRDLDEGGAVRRRRRCQRCDKRFTTYEHAEIALPSVVKKDGTRAEFDPAKLRAAGETFRVLDPACGSGHFLIGAFHRLADYWRDFHGLTEWEASERALESVWGCDINPHAVEIASFRLLLEVVARTRVTDMDRLARLAMNLRTMDSLIPWERTTKQEELFPFKDRLDAYATPKQRRENAAFLQRPFHVVVGNPPYITPKDVRKKTDYKLFWPDSCYMRYALSAPFAERILSIGAADAFTGQITANSFLKRQFGVPVIEKVLPRFDVTHIVDTSGAFIPGHGTPTLIIFARNRPPTQPTIKAILGKRGEPRKPANPEKGLVWSAIAAAGDEPDDSSPFISVTSLSRESMASHPWSLGGGAAGEIHEALESAVSARLVPNVASRLGLMTILKQDDLYFDPPPGLIEDGKFAVRIVEGVCVRDFYIAAPDPALFPYKSDAPTEAFDLPFESPLLHFFWKYRGLLWARTSTGFRTVRDRGLKFYEYPFYFPETYAGPVISFASIATHNHFVLSRGGNLFKQSAPAIKLLPSATLDDHFDLLGLLNSSSIGFWMRQVSHCKGAQGVGEGIKSEEWEQFYDYDSTKLQQAPIATRDRAPRIALAAALDATACERAKSTPAVLLASDSWSPASLPNDLAAAHEAHLGHTRRMVALQEELDWLTYGSYGLVDQVATVDPNSVEPLAPGHRPFEVVLARKDEEADEEEKSAWWSRHGHERVLDIPEAYSAAHRVRLRQRIDLIESDLRLALLETPPFKRRWQLLDWAAETKAAAEAWLISRLEALFHPSNPRGPLAEPKPYRLEEIAGAWSRDPRVAPVAGIWTGTGTSVDLSLVAEKLLLANAVPDNPHRVYTSDGLRKVDEWKRIWSLQDEEDSRSNGPTNGRAHERLEQPVLTASQTALGLDAIPLPPPFAKTDFAKVEFFAVRGKLNVCRERFILFADLLPRRYGWNGWTDRDRALAQVEAFTLAETDPQDPQPVPTPDEPRRCGVTLGLWEALPDVRRWGSAEESGELQALAREACRQARCPCPILDAWKALGVGGHERTPPQGKVKRKLQVVPAVSLAQRAWVASLFQAGRELDLAGVWARHVGRLSEPSQASLPGVTKAPIQLTMPALRDDAAAEHASLDQTTLALVLDDLVASGDLQPAGRGKKKRFQLVVRGGAS